MPMRHNPPRVEVTKFLTLASNYDEAKWVANKYQLWGYRTMLEGWGGQYFVWFWYKPAHRRVQDGTS